MFLICLGIMSLYGLLSMQPDNFTHPSRSRVPHPYLGVGLCGETNYRNYLNITANFRLFFPRPHQDLGMCRQTTLSQHMEMISTLYASVSGETNPLHYWNVTYHSRVFLPYGYLDLGLSRRTTLYKDSEMICTIFANFASLIMVATFVSLCFTGCRRCDNKRRGKRRKLRSCVWTRRRVYWLQKRVSRTEYLGLALNRSSEYAQRTNKRPDSRDHCHVHTTGPCPSSDIPRASVGSGGIQILNVRVNVPFIRNTYRISLAGQPSVHLQPELPCRNETAENTPQEYHVRKSYEEHEDPQWIQTGPEYSSDYSGDGPDSSDAILVDIPEFDPNNNFTVMPNWMRYNPTLHGPKRYSCIICECEVAPCETEKHRTGKRHKRTLSKRGSLHIKRTEALTTELRTSFHRELQLFTEYNTSSLEGALELLTSHDGAIVSVAFIVQDAEIICLSLVTSTVCMNIDRTIFKQPDKLKTISSFKDLFESSTIVFGGDMWELTLLLYHWYNIRCNAFRDVQEFSIEHAGDDIPISNFEVHRNVALKAIQCFDDMHASKTNLLSVFSLPNLVLNHISKLNMKMYSIYREVREEDLDATSSTFTFSTQGTSCIVTSHEYSNRVRLNSTLRMYFGDDIILATCYEWDCSKTGKRSRIDLQSPKPRRTLDKAVLNRRKEKIMGRVLLRHYVVSIASNNFMANDFQKHCYLRSSFNMNKAQEANFQQLVPSSSTLNDLQQSAFVRSFFPISVIHGPPGTGKTRTLAAICNNAVKRGDGVLCLCWTNVAIRNLCEHFRNILPSGTLGIKTSTEYKCWHKSDCKKLEPVEAKDSECQVLCMTVSNYLYNTMEGDSCNKWSSGLFKNRAVLILDEASQLWELWAALLFHRMRGYKRLILAGDDKQLSPYVARDLENLPSIMTWVRRVTKLHQYMVPITFLRMQYRMMPHVGTTVSNVFYKGKLLHNKRRDGDPHMFFHFVEGKMETIMTTRYCVEHSKRCYRIYNNYKSRSPHLTLQVLTFYAAQCNHVKKNYPQMNVCNIDSYQGQQADVVILLLSVKNTNLSRFMLNKGRMCVATSRSKLDLHIVGHWNTMQQDVTWVKILNSCNRIIN